MHFDGPCPFLTCLRNGPHEHPACELCGAVRYGNLFCDTCLGHWDFYDAGFLKLRLLHGRQN